MGHFNVNSITDRYTASMLLRNFVSSQIFDSEVDTIEGKRIVLTADEIEQISGLAGQLYRNAHHWASRDAQLTAELYDLFQDTYFDLENITKRRFVDAVKQGTAHPTNVARLSKVMDGMKALRDHVRTAQQLTGGKSFPRRQVRVTRSETRVGRLNAMMARAARATDPLGALVNNLSGASHATPAMQRAHALLSDLYLRLSSADSRPVLDDKQADAINTTMKRDLSALSSAIDRVMYRHWVVGAFRLLKDETKGSVHSADRRTLMTPVRRAFEVSFQASFSRGVHSGEPGAEEWMPG